MHHSLMNALAQRTQRRRMRYQSAPQLGDIVQPKVESVPHALILRIHRLIRPKQLVQVP